MARNDVIGPLTGGRVGNVSEYNRSLEGTRQNQLKAQAMGLDMQQYEFYRRHPADYIDKHKQFFDAATGVFNIPNVTPGALISNGGAVRGPNGIILAAGSSPTNPVDLASIRPGSPIVGAGHSADTNAWIKQYLGTSSAPVAPDKPSGASLDVGGPTPGGVPGVPPTNQSGSEYRAPRAGSENLLLQPDFGASTDGALAGPLGQGNQNFLPPYLQPGGGAGGSVNNILNRYQPSAPGDATLPPLGTNPLTPAVTTPNKTTIEVPTTPIAPDKPSGASLDTGGFAATAKLLELPYYLRNLGAPKQRTRSNSYA